MKQVSGHRIPLLRRLTVRLTASVIVVLLLIGIPFLFAFHRVLRSQQLQALEDATDALSRIVVDGLRSAMLAREPHLLDTAVRNLCTQTEVERVVLLDHRGRVRVSSDPLYAGRALDRERDATCSVCHETGHAPPSSRATVTLDGRRRVLRTMSTIPNEPQCHGCHDASASTNGILVMDLNLDAADRRFFAGIGSTIALGTVMVLLTVAVLVWLLRRMVHAPLQAVITASERIVDGNLDARAPVPAPGEFARLASQVNRMTDYLSRSLRAVETQHRDLQAILDAVDDEIVVLDRDRRVVAANQAYRRGLGKETGTDLKGRACHDPSEQSSPCALDHMGSCPVQNVFHSSRLSKGILLRPGPDGTERVIEIHASPLCAPDGTVTRAVEVRRDISERRQMEAILAHSEHMASLGLLASGLSHEINNPLGAIATSVAGLRRRLSNDPGISAEASQALDAALGRIAQEVERGRIITHRLLRVARPSGSNRSFVDINRVVEDIVAILSHDITRSRIETRLQLAPNLPPLVGDEPRLAQIIMNVTLNAVQAMPRGGELRIFTSTRNGVIEVEVGDTGSGVPPELIKRLFEPFFTTKPVGKGTGLGLFITHQIVTDMGGTVHVRSQPGRGTTFTIRLPRAESGRRS